MSSGIKKYASILIKGSLAVSLANATTKFASFLLIPLFTYYLSPSDYGITAMVSLVVTVLNLFYNPGMISATMRLYHATDDENQRKELIGSAHRFFLFFPLIFIILGLLWGPWAFSKIFKNFEFYPYGFLALILAFFSQPKRIWVTLMTLQYKVHITAFYSAISIILGLLTTALLVIVFKMGAMVKVLRMFPTVLILFFLSFSTIRTYANGLWSFKSIITQLKFGFPIIISIWSYEFLHVADRYILERMTDIHSVGIYTFGYHLAELPMFLVLGMQQLWNPIFYETMNQRAYKTTSELIKYFIAGLTMINICILLFSKEAILLFINNRYYDVVPIIGVLIVGVYFSGLLTISNSVLAYQNKFGTTSMIALIATVINIVLNIVLIPVIGIMGSALATMIAYIIFFIISIWYQKDTIQMFQGKSKILVPIISMFIVLLINTALFYLFRYKFSVIEIIAKFSLLLTIVFFFYKFELVSKKEVVFIYKSIKRKVGKRKNN